MEIVLENSEIRVSVRPDLGGRMDQITDLKTGRDWLWHPPGYDSTRSRMLKKGDSFDENWTGGWEDIFPNDAAGRFRMWELVDHGELWSRSWSVIETNERGVKMALTCETVPVGVEKTVVLDPVKARVSLSYVFKNKSADSIPFLFKMHPAIAIEEGDELQLPDCRVEPVDLGFSRLIGRKGEFRFPVVEDSQGRTFSLKTALSPETEAREFFYCSDLAEPKCGLYNRRSGTSIHLRFDGSCFPFVWVLQSYGGFRGHYVTLIEPSTTKPYDLEEACRNGTIARLDPCGIKEYSLEVQIERD